MDIHPQPLHGKWQEGFALDAHTISSEFIGHDEYGNPQFDTTYTAAGELLKRLKYKQDKSVAKVLANAIAGFVESRKWPVEAIVPVPPTRQRRGFQPLHILAAEVGAFLGIPVYSDCVVKVKPTPELKDVVEFEQRAIMLENAYVVADKETAGRTLLILDDLYRSGATMDAVAEALKSKGKTRALYALAVTKTRVKR